MFITILCCKVKHGQCFDVSAGLDTHFFIFRLSNDHINASQVNLPRCERWPSESVEYQVICNNILIC